MHRFLRILSVTLITAGLVVMADVGMTLLWKEPLSSIYGSIQQGKAKDELNTLEDEFLTPELQRRVAGIKNIERRVAVLADAFEAEVVDDTGRGIGRIQIPAIDLDIVVVQKTDTASLQKGPGHFTRADNQEFQRRGDGSAFPGQGKTMAIAGHRTTYLAPFRRLNELEAGDEIVLEMPYATFVYELERTRIVDPSFVEIVRNVDHERLVLTACHPLYSAAQRITALAKLTEISLFGSGERIWRDP